MPPDGYENFKCRNGFAFDELDLETIEHRENLAKIEIRRLGEQLKLFQQKKTELDGNKTPLQYIKHVLDDVKNLYPVDSIVEYSLVLHNEKELEYELKKAEEAFKEGKGYGRYADMDYPPKPKIRRKIRRGSKRTAPQPQGTSSLF